MSSAQAEIAIIPCSGIGKSYGTISRIAAYQVTEDDRPCRTRLVPLALLVMGDEEYEKFVKESPAITIDGCPQACATKMVQKSGGTIVRECPVLETVRGHRDLKPQGIAELNEDGEKLAYALAQEVVAAIDACLQPGDGGDHA